MANIVVYESKYGSTKRYAKWIGEELNCKVCKISDVNIEELVNYDNIIFGGWIRAGRLEGFKKIQENTHKLKNKKFFVFAVGLAATEDKTYKDFKEKSFKSFNNIEEFYLNGAFDFNRLTFVDKMMMRVFKIVLKRLKSGNIDESTKEIFRAYEEPVDFTKRESIKPIVEAVKGIDI